MTDNPTNQGHAEQTAKSSIEQQDDKEMTSVSDAPLTAEQRAAKRREQIAHRKEAFDLDRPMFDLGERIILKPIYKHPNCELTGIGSESFNQTTAGRLNMLGDIGDDAWIQTKRHDAAKAFVAEQLRNAGPSDNLRIRFGVFDDDAKVLRRHNSRIFNSAEEVQDFTKPKKKDNSRTISERNDDALDADGDRHRKRLRGDRNQNDAPSQGDFRHKHRRGRRGQGLFNKNQSQAPVLQNEGIQNSPRANSKPSNSRLDALIAPQAQSFNPNSSFAHSQSVMSQSSRSQPLSHSKQSSASVNANAMETNQKPLSLAELRPAPTITADADLDVISVKVEKEEDAYPTPSVLGYTMPFKDFQYYVDEHAGVTMPSHGEDDGFFDLVETELDDLESVKNLFQEA